MDIRYKDIKLYFKEEDHSYTDSLGNSYISCTTLLHGFQPVFDKAYWLAKKAQERGVEMSVIENEWGEITSESCARGNKTHNFFEDNIRAITEFSDVLKIYNRQNDNLFTIADIVMYNDKVKPLDVDEFELKTEGRYPEIYKVFRYYTDKGYKIYSEIGVFLIDERISGTIDILCLKEDKFVVLDWKTNKDGLRFESGYFKKDKSEEPHQLTNEWISVDRTLLYPLNNMPDCNGSIYTLQLNLYAYMVQKILGIPCVGLGLCHIGSPFIKNKYGMPLKNEKGMYTIDPDGEETVKWYHIDKKEKEIEKVVQKRKNDLNTIEIEF